MNKYKYLLSPIELHIDDEFGLSVKLIDWEHQDYIDDVLTEKYGIECEFKTIDEDEKVFILHFGKAENKQELQQAIKSINKYHDENSKIIDTI